MELNELRARLREGVVIPACPLSLDLDRRWSEKYQRALVRYYVDAGAGGLAVGVHSTQFAIRDPQHGLFEPVLSLVADELNSRAANETVRIAGICGTTQQAVAEAETALRLGYHAGLLSMTAVADRSDAEVMEHCRQLAAVLPIVGFYLQPAVGGRVFSHSFWRQFAEIPNVVAIKVAPFNRYRTLDVVRAVCQAERDDIALYTGNDDHILADLLTPYEFDVNGRRHRRFFDGGLLGQWGVWTRTAVSMFEAIQRERQAVEINMRWLTNDAALTDANAAIFDAANDFAGCIPGILEVLRRMGLAPSTACLDPREVLSPGQSQEIDRIWNAYPHLRDDEFVAEHLSEWLA